MIKAIALRFHTGTFLDVCLGVVCLTGLLAETSHAQTGVSHAVMQQLAKQLRADSPAMRDCEAKTEFNFSARAVDLNGDKQPEYLLTSASACECGQVNCSQWVYRVQDAALNLLLEAEGYVLNVRPVLHNGFRDLSTTSRSNAVIVDHVSYAFDGRRYQRASSTIENLDTHEIKPTERQVHFAKGASSATVTGTAAPAFPDSWVFDAKRGQTLALDLQRISGSGATFTVVGPGVDGQRVLVDEKAVWNGRIPQDGSYTILVNSEGEGRVQYSLTIGIR